MDPNQPTSLLKQTHPRHQTRVSPLRQLGRATQLHRQCSRHFLRSPSHYSRARSQSPRKPRRRHPLQSQPLQPPKKSGFLKTFFIVIALVLLGILIGVVVARFLPLASTATVTLTPTPTAEITPSAIPTPSVDITADWQTYTDAKYHFSFKHSLVYSQQQPVLGGDAPIDGHIHFRIARPKVRATCFPRRRSFYRHLGSIRYQYTPYDSRYQNERCLNSIVYLHLRHLLENTTAGSIPVSIYTHTDHFDQTINPGAVDITTYSTFFLLGNNGFILRYNGDNP